MPASKQGRVEVNPSGLTTFVTHGNLQGPVGVSPDTIIEQAWTVLIKAGVFSVDDGTDTPQPLPPATVTLNNGRVIFDLTAEDAPKKEWVGEQLPPLDGLIHALAYAFVAVLNSPPTDGPISWPWSKD
jgi:hypothetical protein